MNRFFFLIILFGLASVASFGMLTNTFDMMVQKLGVFHTADVGLTGCRCFDAVTGVEIIPCDGVVTSDQLCILKPSP